MAIWKKFFGQAQMPAASEPKLELPGTCDQFLVIGSPELTANFAGDLIVSAEALEIWVRTHLVDNQAMSPPFIANATRLAQWLQSALTNDMASTFPHAAYSMVRNSVSDFVNSPAARVRCRDCGALYTSVKVEKTFEDHEILLETTERWTCSRGHQIYFLKSGVHISLAD